MPFAFGQLAQSGDTLIKARPIALNLLEQCGEGRHPLIIEAKRQQLGVVYRRVDPVVVTPATAPLAFAECMVFGAQAGDLGLLATAHLRGWQIAGIELLQACSAGP